MRSFTNTIFLSLIIAQCTHTINWPWWAIASPLWVHAFVWVIIQFLYSNEECKEDQYNRKDRPEKRSEFMNKLNEAMKNNPPKRL